jgi:hypothetical protein
MAAAAMSRTALTARARLHYASLTQAKWNAQIRDWNESATFTPNALAALVLLQFKNLACYTSSGNDLREKGRFRGTRCASQANITGKAGEQNGGGGAECLTINSTLSPVMMSLSPAEA